MPNDTATDKASSAEHRDDTIAHGCHGSLRFLVRERRNAATTRSEFFSASVPVMSWPSDDSLEAKGDSVLTPGSKVATTAHHDPRLMS